MTPWTSLIVVKVRKENEIETIKWLKENNLSHLMRKFKQNGISIHELSEMSRDDLTDILNAL